MDTSAAEMKDADHFCPFCEIKFRAESLLIAHYSLLHPEEDDYFCNICRLRFSTESILKMHNFVLHPDVEDVAQTPVIDLDDENPTPHLTPDVTSPAEIEYNDYVCSICEVEFAAESLLFDHCSAMHSRDVGHSSHVGSNLRGSNPQRSCEQLNNSPSDRQTGEDRFTSENSLEELAKDHASERLVTNPRCGDEVSNKPDPQTDRSTKQRKKKELQLKCHIDHYPRLSDVCEYKLASGDLDGKSADDSQAVDEHGKQLRCPFCYKKFAVVFMLNEHKRVCTGGKPLACETCGRKFSLINELRLHRKIHRRTARRKKIKPGAIIPDIQLNSSEEDSTTTSVVEINLDQS